MTNKNNDKYAVSEAIAALLAALDEMGMEFEQESLDYEYDKDEGQFVHLLSENLPDFEVEADDMLLISDFEWVVKRIKRTEDGDYRTTFHLEDAI